MCYGVRDGELIMLLYNVENHNSFSIWGEMVNMYQFVEIRIKSNVC